jgi:hypothetical protein
MAFGDELEVGLRTFQPAFAELPPEPMAMVDWMM